MRYEPTIYVNLARQISHSLKQNQSSDIRAQAQLQILRYLLRCLDMTSAYICQYDAVQRSATVVAEYIAKRASSEENLSDLYEVYTEDELGDTITWLEQISIEPRILHVDELAENDPEREEFIRYGAKTMLHLPLYHEQHIWGWAEIWESRHKKLLTEEELTSSLRIVDYLSQLI